MADLLLECGVELCTECCVSVAEDSYEKKAHPDAFLAKGIRLSDCADDSDTIALLQNKFPNLPILFPENVDVPNTNGNSVAVWYIVSEEGIHRISVNRSLIGFFPTYYAVDGDLICLIADNKHSTVTFNTNPEIIQKYDPRLDRDWSGQTTITLIVGNNTVRINSGGGSVCREFFCSFIYRRPVTLKLFVGSPTSFNVENPAERWVEKKNCCPTLLYGIILFPLLILWLFLILILIFAKCMTCCCFRGPIKRKVVIKDNAANRCKSYPIAYFYDHEASPLLQTPSLSSPSPQPPRMENV